MLVSYPALTLLDDGRSVCPDSRAGMTVAEWVEYAQKAQIYHNAAELLTGNPA